MLFHLEGLKFDGGLSGTTPFTVSEMRGWDVGGAEMHRQRDARPGTHGAFPARGYLTDRAVEWSGLVLTDSVEEQQHALRQLSGLLAQGGTGQLAGAGVWAEVERDEIPPPQIEVPGKIARYTVKLSAPDARLYGTTREFAAGEEAIQYGNFPARPRIIVSGVAAAGYTITGPGGRRVVVTRALSAAQPHTIDFVKGGLWINGERIMRAITIYQPWEVGPGVPGAVTTVTGSLTLRVQVTDTYV